MVLEANVLHGVHQQVDLELVYHTSTSVILAGAARCMAYFCCLLMYNRARPYCVGTAIGARPVTIRLYIMLCAVEGNGVCCIALV